MAGQLSRNVTQHWGPEEAGNGPQGRGSLLTAPGKVATPLPPRGAGVFDDSLELGRSGA